MDALLELFIGGLADEDGSVVLGLDLNLQDVGRDVATEVTWFDGRVDTLSKHNQGQSSVHLTCTTYIVLSCVQPDVVMTSVSR